MTENEAIKNIKALNAVCWQKDFYDEEFARALATAIQALEEIQQYKVIGTVEKVQELASKGRAYEQVAWERDVALEQLKEIGLSLGEKTDDVRVAVERMKPKKPIEVDNWGEYYKCPTCKKYAVDSMGCKYKYCPNCGTEFDWSE